MPRSCSLQRSSFSFRSINVSMPHHAYCTQNLSRLQPYQSLLAVPDNRLLIGDFAGDLVNYLQYSPDRSNYRLSFRTHDYSALGAWDRQQPLEAFLAQRGFTAIFVQPRIMGELLAVPAAKALLDGDTQYRRVSPLGDRDWGLYVLFSPRQGS